MWFDMKEFLGVFNGSYSTLSTSKYIRSGARAEIIMCSIFPTRQTISWVSPTVIGFGKSMRIKSPSEYGFYASSIDLSSSKIEFSIFYLCLFLYDWVQCFHSFTLEFEELFLHCYFPVSAFSTFPFVFGYTLNCQARKQLASQRPNCREFKQGTPKGLWQG